MGAPPLACTVRGCGTPLARRARAWACARGHSFDIARHGYVNLLQPSDRRSRDAGDSRAAVEARARLLATGVGRHLADLVVEQATNHLFGEVPVVVDLGSGSGDTLAAIARQRSVIGIGIDLSTAAAEHSARRHPDLTWVVANADRRLPLLDESVDLVISQQGRRQPAECARILRPGGHLVVSVPAPDDLIELRDAIQGAAVERDRMDGVVAAHAGLFSLVSRTSARERQPLGRAPLVDLLTGTYRGRRHASGPRIAALEELTVSLASTIAVFRRS